MDTLKNVALKHKWLVIASLGGFIFSVPVALDSPDLSLYQAFFSSEVMILIVYFVVLNSKKKKAHQLQALQEAQALQEKQQKEQEEYWASLTPEQQIVELKKKEIAKSEAMHQENIRIQQDQLNFQKAQFDSMKKCPKCGSTSISGQKKGYGVVKGIAGGVVGATLALPLTIVGLGAGNINRNKVYCTCMSCGYRWKAGKK